MLIKKGGIVRDVDEKRVHEYIARGYKRVEAAPDKQQAKKPVKE